MKLTREVKIAVTAIVAVVILVFLINFLKGVDLLKGSNSYYVRFSNIQGLAVSNAVYANGYAVGTVRSIEYDYSRTDNVVVCIELDKQMNVPEGSHAELETELMGGVKMNLVLGPNPTRNLAPGDTLAGGMYQGAMAKLEKMIPAIEQILPKLDSILTNLNRLSGDPALAQTLQNTAQLTANLRDASGELNTLMQGEVPQMVRKFNNVGSNVETLTANLNKIDLDGTVQTLNSSLSNVQTLTGNLTQTTETLNSKLNSRDNTLGLFLNDRSLYDNLNSTMSHADSLMIDLKAHPKRYVHFSVFGKKDK